MEYVPFYVRAQPGGPKAKVAFLEPTASYMAYVNIHWMDDADLNEIKFSRLNLVTPADAYLNEHPEIGLSTYDHHSDGSGVACSSRLRPILDMRPNCVKWCFEPDSHITDWLEAKSFAYDVRGDVHTNTTENYFSILKRGIAGVYHHVSQQHLKRYLAEFDFRYNERAALGIDDQERTELALRGIVRKRLTYRGSPKGLWWCKADGSANGHNYNSIEHRRGRPSHGEKFIVPSNRLFLNCCPWRGKLKKKNPLRGFFIQSLKTTPLTATGSPVALRPDVSTEFIASHAKTSLAHAFDALSRGNDAPPWMDHHAREKGREFLSRNMKG